MDILVQPIVLSGGSGTRLWPLSREAYPKQFLPITGANSLLTETVIRTHKLEDSETSIQSCPPVVVCNESHRFLVAEQLRLAGFEDNQIILEPVGRNTAPALTLAAELILRKELDPVLAIMPSDHLISDEPLFRNLLAHAARLADSNHVVTFGINPDKPETGFGYIRTGDRIDDIASTLVAFVEKPDLATAEEYIASNQYFWNSGIFVMRASIWIQEAQKYCPEIVEKCRKAIDKGQQDGQFFRVDSDGFEECPGISIDNAVMENIAKNNGQVQASVIPMDVGWSDLGSWSSLREIQKKDVSGNVIRGDVFVKDTQNSLLYSENRFVAAVGVDDVIVIETPDAVLVAHKDKAQDIKSITEHLKSENRSEHVFHSKVHRPWGDYESIDSGARYQVKRLSVKPGASLSLQMHHHRAEHWIVVCGTARVTRGEDSFLLGENQSTYIPLGVTHRLENPGNIDLEIIEVQSGSYLQEDDIVRFEDRYNRVE